MKVCVITMVYGFTGMVPSNNGFTCANTNTTRSRQFVLERNQAYQDQIMENMVSLEKDCSSWYYSVCHSCVRDYGHIMSHSVTVIDHV